MIPGRQRSSRMARLDKMGGVLCIMMCACGREPGAGTEDMIRSPSHMAAKYPEGGESMRLPYRSI